MRLDQFLFDNGLVPSRERGRSLIMAGKVFVNGARADKAGMAVADDAVIEVRGEDHPYVSRGGLKLEKALKTFQFPVDGLVCMDVGASTGGFTDCLLQNGAKRVYAIDVGYGQLDWKLRNDERVVVLERTNIRKLTTSQMPENAGIFTIDVSFISLNIVLNAIVSFVDKDCKGICLVKPQFEAGKENVGKNGVVRDPKVQLQVLHDVILYANNCGFSVVNIDYSPIKGPKGNIEYLMGLERGSHLANISSYDINEAVSMAWRELKGDE